MMCVLAFEASHAVLCYAWQSIHERERGKACRMKCRIGLLCCVFQVRGQSCNIAPRLGKHSLGRGKANRLECHLGHP